VTIIISLILLVVFTKSVYSLCLLLGEKLLTILGMRFRDSETLTRFLCYQQFILFTVASEILSTARSFLDAVYLHSCRRLPFVALSSGPAQVSLFYFHSTTLKIS
jgi:hypothetical protein